MNSGSFLPIQFSADCTLIHLYTVSADQISDPPGASGISPPNQRLRNSDEQPFVATLQAMAIRWFMYFPAHGNENPGSVCTPLYTLQSREFVLKNRQDPCPQLPPEGQRAAPREYFAPHPGQFAQVVEFCPRTTSASGISQTSEPGHIGQQSWQLPASQRQRARASRDAMRSHIQKPDFSSDVRTLTTAVICEPVSSGWQKLTACIRFHSSNDVGE